LIDSNLASGTKSGYSFAIGNCSGTPAFNYNTVAAPVSPGTTGQRYFCSDSSGVIKYDPSSTSNCTSSGVPI
jgi:hypothetical protein